MAKFLKEKISVHKIDETLKQEMFRLFERYYEEVSYTKFCDDLANKTAVLLFRENVFTLNVKKQALEKRVVGFSTLVYRRLKVGPTTTATFLFSGDTVLDSAAWGSKILQSSFFWEIVKAKLMNPFSPVYWMLISKGYKTYLMMRRNFAKSFPNSKSKTDPQTMSAQNIFYTDKFGECYNPETGLIILDDCKGAVKDGVSPVTEALKRNPDVAFFVQKNPEFQNGVELACIAHIRFSDFPHHVLKYFCKPLVHVFHLVFKQKERLRA
jgi:hypothetical protein